jgi:hypothetical protein
MSEGLSADAKAIVDAMDTNWIGRGALIGVGMSLWFGFLGIIVWAVMEHLG